MTTAISRGAACSSQNLRRAQRSGNSLPSFSFASLTPGAVSLPAGLTLTRASGASVQTGTSALVTGLGVDVARAGRRLDSDSVGLVIEESRTNLVDTARAMVGGSWSSVGAVGTPTPSQSSPDGTSNATRWQTSSTAHSAYYTRAPTDGAVYMSAWMRTRATPYVHTIQFGNNTTISLTTAWQRFGAAFTSVGTYYLTPNNAIAASAQDSDSDLYQIEAGAFPTEWIPGGATRAGDRLQCTRRLDSGGRLAIEIECRPKGARTAYATAHWIYVNANTRVTLETDGKVSCVIDGITYTTPGAVDWLAHDTVRIWIEIGAGVPSLVAIQVNDTDPLLLSTDESPIALGSWTATTCDLLNGAGTSQFSCWLLAVRAFEVTGSWLS